MLPLTCALRDYDWGSTSLIPRFLDVPADGTTTYAEMWLGAHPGDPAHLPDGQRLDDYIASRPEAALGVHNVETFGPRLPYLLKALAAARPLSLQVHPTSQRARIGYELEDQAGIPVGAPHRSYQDRHHKPEMIVALTRFEGMAGFRDVEKTTQILRLLQHPWADGIAKQLEDGPAFQALHAVVTEILALSDPPLRELTAEIAQAARDAEQRGHAATRPIGRHYLDRASVERESTRLFAQTALLAERYPADPGVLVTLLLNHVVLSPGEAMFLDAGVVHAYTSGFGIEIMASSDNVVRAGLTSKHVDVPELLEIASFTPIPPPLWEPTPSGPGELHYNPPVTEFGLTVLRPGDDRLAGPASGPRIVLSLEGDLRVTTRGDERVVRRGEAVFVEDHEGPLRVAGHGAAVVASIPGS